MRAAETSIEDPPIEASNLLDPNKWWRAYILAWLPLGLSYLIILGLFVDIDGQTLLVTWLANVLFPSIVSIGVVWVILKEVVYKSWRTQVLFHTIGAVLYSALWAMTLFRLLQLFKGLMSGDWSPPIWPSPVIAWQLFQGLALYFIVASGTYAYWALAKLKQNGLTVKSEKLSKRIYARSELGLVPVSIKEISAVKTGDGTTALFVGPTRLEARLSISDLEGLLPPEKFVRIHRTAIINLDHIQSVEPAGNGRQTIHLVDGLTLETSRAGTSALKARFAIV